MNAARFLIAEDSLETRAEVIARNIPSELIFMVPQLAAGVYEIEVRSTGIKGKTLKTGKLEPTVVVE